MVLATDAGRMLTVRDVSKALNIREQTVTQWARTGLLRGFRISTQRWRFNPEDVAAFLEARKNTSQNEHEADK